MGVSGREDKGKRGPKAKSRQNQFGSSVQTNLSGNDYGERTWSFKFD